MAAVMHKIQPSQIHKGFTGERKEFKMHLDQMVCLGICGIKDGRVVNPNVPNVDAGCAVRYAGNTIIYNNTKDKCYILSGMLLTSEVEKNLSKKIIKFALIELGKNMEIYTPEPLVYVNGQLLVEGKNNDYEVKNNEIIFGYSPHQNDTIQIHWR